MKRSNLVLIAGLIIEIIALLAPLEGDLKGVAMGVGVAPILWRGVELFKARFPAAPGDAVWTVANGLGLLIPVAAYLIMVATGQEAFTQDGVLTSLLAGTAIATSADGVHRVAQRQREKEQSGQDSARRNDTTSP